MNKYCGKCGAELSDDDFLCPQCGAIWGDRIYHVPQGETACEEEIVIEQPQAEELTEEIQPQKKQPRWLLPVAAAVLILGFVLLWLGSDRDPWAGESSPATTSKNPTKAQSDPDHIFTFPIAYTTYTVKFIDPLGNPVPDVVIAYPTTDPAVSATYQVATSDQKGNATFHFPIVAKPDIQIVKIPEGYMLLLPDDPNDTIFSFENGATEMTITLLIDELISIQPILPQSYLVEMLDPDWLYEELNQVYPVGYQVEVKIKKSAFDVGYMMLMNGVEIPSILTDGPYLLYSFTMPEEDVTLDLKIIQDREYEDMIRNYYLQYPNAEDIEVIQYYGRYDISDVVILSAYSPDSIAHQTYVGGYCFRYPNQNGILLQVAGRYYSLSAAYESGFISKTDLADIYRQHTICFWDLYEYEVDPIV